MIRNLTGSDIALQRFHSSLYISLALACACLTFVEWWFLPEIVALAGFVFAAMIIAYRAENKWSLSLRAANGVGAVIALILIAWAVYHFLRPTGTLLNDLPPQAAMLVYLGPLVMILIPAKLFRPKHKGDYWSMQLIGLMTVALACALGGNSAMLIFVMAYALSAVWCLTRFHAVMNADASHVLQNKNPEETKALQGRLWAITTIGGSTRLSSDDKKRVESNIFLIGLWTAMAMALALVFSLATPRNSEAQWGVGRLAVRTTIGISDDRPQIDLNFTGDLESNNEVAFVVRAENSDHQPKLDLSPSQKWRGGSFNFYDQGKWANRMPRQSIDFGMVDRGGGRSRGMNFPPKTNQPARHQGLPDLGSRQYFLLFPIPSQPRSTYYLANPVWSSSTRSGAFMPVPVISETPEGVFNWTALRDGEVIPPLSNRGERLQSNYRQVTAPTSEPGLSAPVAIDSAFKELLTYVVGLKALHEYSSSLLQQLIVTNQLPNLKSWTPDAGPIPVDRHEEVARAMEKFFHSSGQFEYSTQGLRQVDLTLDPIEDFLLNIRQGHCNRFATALTLLLRAQSIPARIVLGYEGCESNGDGSYTIRQMHAHSWVECLVRRTGADGNPTWHWLTLDPTPSIERLPVVENQFTKWLENTIVAFGEFMRTFVLELNAERQDRARATLSFLSPLEWGPRFYQFLMTPIGWVAAGGIFFGTWLLRRWRWKQNSGISHVYRQLREKLEKAHLMDSIIGLTPHELRRFAEGQIENPDAVLAATSIVDCHTRSIYGGDTVAPNELAKMNAALQTIANYCRRHHRRSRPIPIEN